MGIWIYGTAFGSLRFANFKSQCEAGLAVTAIDQDTLRKEAARGCEISLPGRLKVICTSIYCRWIFDMDHTIAALDQKAAVVALDILTYLDSTSHGQPNLQWVSYLRHGTGHKTKEVP